MSGNRLYTSMRCFATHAIFSKENNKEKGAVFEFLEDRLTEFLYMGEFE